MSLFTSILFYRGIRRVFGYHFWGTIFGVARTFARCSDDPMLR